LAWGGRGPARPPGGPVAAAPDGTAGVPRGGAGGGGASRCRVSIFYIMKYSKWRPNGAIYRPRLIAWRGAARAEPSRVSDAV
jgi:hypothetical protein